MTFVMRMLLAIPPGAGEQWVTDVPCDCKQQEGPHTNDWRVIDEWICMATVDDDGVIFKWQVLFMEDGSQFARGFGLTIEEARQGAEITARALSKDRAAFLAEHPAESLTQ